jgi:hypothetical protein
VQTLTLSLIHSANMAPRKAKRRATVPDVPDHIQHILDFVTDLTPCFLVCKAWHDLIVLKHPQLTRIDKLNSYQRSTLEYIDGFRLKNIVAAVDRRCVVCNAPWRGGIHDVFGIPAHPACVKKNLINSVYATFEDRYARHHVMAAIPHCTLEGYNRGSFEYDAVWLNPHPAVPTSWTVRGYERENAVTIATLAAAERAEADRVSAEARELETQARALVSAQRKMDRDDWTHTFKTAAKQMKAPFKTLIGMRRSLPTGLASVVHFEDDAARSVVSGTFVHKHIAKVPENEDVWRWILHGPDLDTRLARASACIAGIHASLLSRAFSVDNADPGAFVGLPVVDASGVCACGNAPAATCAQSSCGRCCSGPCVRHKH